MIKQALWFACLVTGLLMLLFAGWGAVVDLSGGAGVSVDQTELEFPEFRSDKPVSVSVILRNKSWHGARVIGVTEC
jgi:hypothetical protein